METAPVQILKIQPKNEKNFPLVGLKCGTAWCYSLGVCD